MNQWCPKATKTSEAPVVIFVQGLKEDNVNMFSLAG